MRNNRLIQSLKSVYTLLFFGILSIASVSASGQDAGGGWLDRPLKNWNAPGRAIERTYWALKTLNGKAVYIPNEQRKPFLQLNPDNGRLSASAGCNSLGGTYELDGNNIKIELGPSTLMACEGLMDLERDYIKALSSAAKWRIEGDKLTITTGDNIRMEFRAQKK